MGINGLLPLLRSITKQVHISALAGQSVAIDAYSWLHKSVHFCAVDLYHQRPTTAYIEYCMEWIRVLQSYAVTPILVFDGGPLPMKAHREIARLNVRNESKRKAEEAIKNRDMNARQYMTKAIDITPEMAHQLILQLRRERIEYVVAPYEADSQMAYLERKGKVSAIITEDSDLLLFGCQRVLFKLDKDGYAEEILLSNLGNATELDFYNFSFQQFRQMCILSGCDYLPSVPGVGLKTAYKWIQQHRTIEKVFAAMRSEERRKALVIPNDYEVLFYKAELTFQYQTVHDIDLGCNVHLNEIDSQLKQSLLDDWNFLGPILEDEIACGIAMGQLDPMTFEAFKQPSYIFDFEPDTPPTLERENKKPALIPLATGIDHRLSLKRNYTTAINTSCKSYAESIKSHRSTPTSRAIPPLTEHLQHIPSYLLKAVKPRKSDILPANQTTILKHLTPKPCD